MPRPYHNPLPPTPGSSTDIKGQDGTVALAPLHMSFELPPPALHDTANTPPADADPARTGSGLSPTSPSSGFPVQAAEAVKARRRSPASAGASASSSSNSFALPPPPTRSRKIIQMKPPKKEPAESQPASVVAAGAPRGRDAKSTKAGSGGGSSSKVGATAGSAAAAAGSGTSAANKKKQPSATSAAGRKIARKTAHSLIERRRRSKMNEEFAVLKSMIPACTGEMHKLAILQASIEYVRYLEDCVSKLKEQHEDDQSRAQLPSIREFHPTFRDDGDNDVEMSDSAAVSPQFRPQPDQQQAFRAPISPALHAQDARARQHSYSSASTDHRHYSYGGASGTTSPALGPHAGRPFSNAGSALTSPALNPQSDLDQEAMAALLMLNTDRRAGSSGGGRRAVSVRDLLASQ